MAKYQGVTPVDPNSSNPFWQYRIKIKSPDGKVVDTKIRKDSDGNPFLTARSAFEAKLAHIDKIRNPPAEKPQEAAVVTVGDVYQNYLNTEAKKRKAGTLRKQESMWENHIKDVFGDRDINSIKVIDLDTYLVDLYKTYTWSYVQGFLRFFYLIFGHAERMEVLEAGRYRTMFGTKGTRLEMPKKRQSPNPDDEDGAVVYDDEEIKVMEEVLKDNNLLLSFHLGLYCGLRISECFGLRWRDIDFDNKVINVSRQLLWVDDAWHLTGVKTDNSVRKVYITDQFKEELLMYFDFYKGFKRKLKEKYRDNEIVYDELENRWLKEDDRDFVNRRNNGELLTSYSMKYWSKQLTVALHKHTDETSWIYTMGNGGQHVNIHYKDFKYHSLRKTFGTRCASRNIPIFLLMSMMGHTKIETTKKYYINVEEKYMVDHTRSLLEGMYGK